MKYDLFLWLIFAFLGFVCGWASFSSDINTSKAPIANVSDTTLSGMHYVIWTEPRTGDLVVCNTTIDSLKVIMFKSQIK